VYDRGYELYNELYDKLKGTFRKFSS